MKLAMCVASSTRTRLPSEGTPSVYEMKIFTVT